MNKRFGSIILAEGKGEHASWSVNAVEDVIALNYVGTHDHLLLKITTKYLKHWYVFVNKSATAKASTKAVHYCSSGVDQNLTMKFNMNVCHLCMQLYYHRRGQWRTTKNIINDIRTEIGDPINNGASPPRDFLQLELL